ncbi:cytochrome family protein [Bradyrhizobium hipponense]|nr:cytochrome family protein [Bradyrhizobium hipponense]
MIETGAAHIRRRPILVAMVAIAVAAFLAIALVSSRSVSAGPEAPSPAAIRYLPSISDLMIETIQPRHERLWRAEQEGNWDFAAYELRALRGAFDRLGRSHPTDQQTSLPQMIASVTEQPFRELNGAIQAKDGTAFAKTYAGLTDACNSCHQALNHGVVEIRVPSRTSPSDLNGNDVPHN